ncbi:hypothetical protein NQ318_017750 [Aromia moschata]|uniref:Uncharacterized protein n=1 Tax=Aromia moschata TaxID=1265417 RepID=A0AAV8Y7D3_9CUCU|nr:hypothetical protein NQ318_017750 [Aromia moschata]
MQRSLEQRMAIKFCVKLEKSAAETIPMLKKAFGVNCLSDRQPRWTAINLQFRRQCETYITKTIVHEIVSESLGMRKAVSALAEFLQAEQKEQDQGERRVNESCII